MDIGVTMAPAVGLSWIAIRLLPPLPAAWACLLLSVGAGAYLSADLGIDVIRGSVKDRVLGVALVLLAIVIAGFLGAISPLWAT